MPIDNVLINISDFTGGLNTNSGNVVGSGGFMPNQASKLENAIISKSGGVGALTKIPGRETKLTLDEPCLGLFKAKFKDGTQRVIATGTTKLYEVNINDYSYQQVGDLFTEDDGLVDFEMMNDYVMITREGNVPRIVDSVMTSSDVTGFPPTGVTGNPSQCEQHKGRMWLSRNPDQPDEMYWSEFGVVTSWDAQRGAASGGFLGLPNGSIIKACKSLFGDMMFIYTNREIWTLAGDVPEPTENYSVFRTYVSYDDVDFESPFSIVNNMSVQYFFNGTDVTAISPSDKFGDLDRSVITFNISPTLKAINSSARDKIFGYYLGDNYKQIWWFIPVNGSTYNNALLIYDLDFKAFLYCPDRGANCMTILDDGSILSGHQDGSIKQEMIGNDDDGDPIEFVYDSGWYLFDTYQNIQRIEITHYQTGDDELTLKVYKNLNDNAPALTENLAPSRISTWGSNWGVMVWGAPTISKTRRDALGSCHSLKIEVTNNNDTPLRILSIKVFGGKKQNV